MGLRLATARSARTRNVPSLLWRLRGSVGGLTGIAGSALSLRVFTPGFVGLTAFAALVEVGHIGGFSYGG